MIQIRFAAAAPLEASAQKFDLKVGGIKVGALASEQSFRGAVAAAAAAVAGIGPAVAAAVNFLLGLEASRDPFFISALRVINDGGVGPDNSAARMSKEVLRKGSK